MAANPEMEEIIMFYHQTMSLKNGALCVLRNAEGTDAESFLDYFLKAHGETDFLTTYPEEANRDLVKIAALLDAKTQSARSIEIIAVADGKVVGSAGIHLINDREKTRHRAEFGISVRKDYWHLGIGSALTAACIACAKEAGYLQMELEVVAENQAAVSLYLKHGFVKYGSNPRGFRNREGKWQELVLMRLELDG